ncbi:MAG: adenosylhomocysteinase [Thermoleophilaceae bacterium]
MSYQLLATRAMDAIEWAAGQMPVVARIASRFERARPFDGVRLGCSLHVTAETGVLVRALMAGGAEVAVCAPNPLSTQDDVADALASSGAAVHARHGQDPAVGLAAVVDTSPELTMDDGADLISALARSELIGATEETTTGVIRARTLELAFPVVAVNEGRAKDLFDNRYGTGQSTLDGILRATNVLLAGRRVVVIGYGRCGRGVAARAKGAGAQVIVCEVDPLAALEAAMDGFEVMPALTAAERGDLFITATGNRDALTAEHFERMPDGAILCNAGHFDVEIDKGALAAMAAERRQARPASEEFVLADGRRLHLLADGRVVNLAAAEGHPAAVMDVIFACQALAAEYLVANRGGLEAGVHALPNAIDVDVARLKLEAMGVQLDELSDEQRAYLSTWR